MQSLDSLIGRKVIVAIKGSEEAYYELKLHAVEQGGVWLQGDAINSLVGSIHRSLGDPPEIPVVFVPYAQLLFLVASSVDLRER